MFDIKAFAKEYYLSPSVAEYVVRAYYQKLKVESQKDVDDLFENHFPNFRRFIKVEVIG